MLFSVYGHIKKCDLIRDWKTGQSLQYAFIEYETKAAAEEAYFKMDNALVDERRIHVDFSQSVSRLWNKFRRREHHSTGDQQVATDVSLKTKFTRPQARLLEADFRERNAAKPSQEVRDSRTSKSSHRPASDRRDTSKRKDTKRKHRRSSSSSRDSSSLSSRSSNDRKKKKRERSRDKK